MTELDNGFGFLDKIKLFIIEQFKKMPKESFKIERSPINRKESINISLKLVQEFIQVSKNLLDVQIKENILFFYSVLNEKIPQEYLINFYNNVKTLCVNCNMIEPERMTNSDVYGEYCPKSNSISIVDAYDKNILFHELMHMASCASKGEKLFCGFEQSNNGQIIGTGLNEIFTCYFVEKYFGKSSDEATIVDLIPSFPILFNKLVGESIEKYYFSSDLYGLINSIKPYASDKDINNFIKDIDMFYFEIIKKRMGIDDWFFAIYDLKKVYRFLLKTYYVKCTLESELETEASEKFEEFIGDIPFNIEIENGSIHIINNRDIDECISAAKKHLNRSSNSITR